jgi:hypothetical protein
MSWEAIGAIGQAVSALALVFVLVQLRHAHQEMRRSISQARANGGRELWMLRADNPQLSGLLLRIDAALSGRENPLMAEIAEKANITPEEAMLAFSHQWAWWIYQQQVIPLVKELRPGERAQFNQSLRRLYSISPFGRVWFQAVRDVLDPDAVRYVDDLLAEDVARS